MGLCGLRCLVRIGLTSVLGVGASAPTRALLARGRRLSDRHQRDGMIDIPRKDDLICVRLIPIDDDDKVARLRPDLFRAITRRLADRIAIEKHTRAARFTEHD